VTKNPQVLISTREAAAILKEDPRSVQRKASAGTLPFVQKMPGAKGAYIFDEASIRKFKEIADKESAALAEDDGDEQ